MEALTLVYFAGCPNAERARAILQQSGQPFREVCQDTLPAGHPYWSYASPSILLGERLVFGEKTGEGAGGCSIEPLDGAALLARIEHATAG